MSARDDLRVTLVVDIRLVEIIALEEQRPTVVLRHRVGKAIGQVQPRLSDLAFRPRPASLPHGFRTPAARGTHDLIGEDQRRHHHVVETARRIAASYGFDEWITPIFEDTRVFSRTLGRNLRRRDEGDVHVRGSRRRLRSPCARKPPPAICRALVTNGLTQSLPQKVFYAGPMFRYERPQKGRYRQFHQIDIELIGSAEPLADAEVIACGWDILQGARRRRRDRAGAQHAGRHGEPRGLPRRAGGATSPRTSRRCRRTAWRGWSAIRCASWTARTRETAASSPARRPSPLS